MRIITINKINPDGSLELPNHGNSNADKGEEVQWNFKPGIGVGAITEISMKPGIFVPPNTDIFTNDPPKPYGNGPNQHWKGTVDSGAKDFAEYNYYIKWDDTKSPVGHHTQDPKIIVNSGRN